MSPRNRTPHRIVRQCLGNRVAHWLVALSTFALIFSGFGQMPMYARYGLADLPKMAWTADYDLQLAIHTIAAIALMTGIAFHLVYALRRRRYDILPRRGDVKESAQIIAAMLGRGEEPESHKYLAEQRLAYAFIGANLLLVTATGVVKVVKNLPGITLPGPLVFSVTMVHNLTAMLLVLGVLAHLAAFAFKANRALLPAMISGRVDAAYARTRHGAWHREVAPLESIEGTELAEDVSSAADVRDDTPHRAAV